MSDLIPFHGTNIVADQIDGTPHIAVRPVCESLGLTPDSQVRKLNAQPWATTAVMEGVGADGKPREMTFVDRRTFTMWLATIQTSRIKNESARELLVAYQREAADALDRYFHEGGAINPAASEHQVNALIRQSQMRMELIQAARGLIQPDHLEAKARVILAQGIGEAPTHPENRILYVQDYLKEKGLSTKQRKSVQSMFGKRAKAAYIAEHGCPPGTYPLNLTNGQTRDVVGYTEADRDLLDGVWRTHYATQEAMV